LTAPSRGGTLRECRGGRGPWQGAATPGGWSVPVSGAVLRVAELRRLGAWAVEPAEGADAVSGLEDADRGTFRGVGEGVDASAVEGGQQAGGVVLAAVRPGVLPVEDGHG